MKMQEKKIKQNKMKSEYNRRKRSILAYVLGTMGLMLLVTAAFFGPQIVFAMQDDIRCSAVVFMSPESVDITSFNTGYETDLYKRLERFAKGLAEGREYYVTVQDMELSTEIADWAASEQGFYQEGFQVLVWNLGLIPGEVFDYNLISWKRCVIYGDDFAGGVNFILWYLELGGNDEPVIRLLVDGETGEIYGIRTNFNAYFQDEQIEKIGTSMNLTEFYGIHDENMWELSLVIGDYYCGLKIADMLNWLTYMGCEYYLMDGVLCVDITAEYDVLRAKREQIAVNLENPDSDWVNRYSAEEIQDFMQKLQWRVSEDGNCLDFDFPYNENSLKFRVSLDGKIRWLNKWKTNFYDILFGFPEIYERIPVFMEDWN